VLNDDPLELFVWIGRSVSDIYRFGVSTPNLFLLGRRDAEAMDCEQGTVLRLIVAPGVAVDVSQHLPGVYPEGTVLLPLAALEDITTGSLCDAGGVPQPIEAALIFDLSHPSHGIDGLPSDVVFWPQARRLASAASYLLLPWEREVLRERLHSFPGWLPLFQRQPEPAPGFLVARLHLSREAAIDVPATLDLLSGVHIIQSGLRRFRGLDLVLPQREFATTMITSLTGPHAQRWEPALRTKSVAEALSVLTGHGSAGDYRAA
jgi:hypothetical protein